MNLATFMIACTSMICAVFAFILCYHGKDDGGWFLFTSAVLAGAAVLALCINIPRRAVEPQVCDPKVEPPTAKVPALGKRNKRA